MPYFVFRISEDGKPSFENEYATFKEARKVCRDYRMSKPEGDLTDMRMIFAKDRKEGRRLLSVKRKPPTVEEWEA